MEEREGGGEGGWRRGRVEEREGVGEGGWKRGSTRDGNNPPSQNNSLRLQQIRGAPPGYLPIHTALLKQSPAAQLQMACLVTKLFNIIITLAATGQITRYRINNNCDSNKYTAQ